jgi:hypothetical protein
VLLSAMILTFVVYLMFFDILIPNMPSDSYRSTAGIWFVIPVALLMLGQTLIGGLILHLFSIAANPKNAYILWALLVASIVTFCFSLTYMFFPKYGPFYYIVFVYSSAMWYALPVELGWSFFTFAVGSYLAYKLLKMPYKLSLLAIFVVYVVIVLAAS